jgi:thiol-disulfide isomerase/thioredoxin
VKRRKLLSQALAGLVLAPAAAVRAAPAQRGQAVTWPEVTLLDGGRFGAPQAAGQAVVVVFWSTSCPFCRRHNQHIERLHRAAAGQRLRVLGVARESDAALVRRFAQQQGYSFPITLDHAPMAAALASRTLIPLTATIDRQGLLHEVIPGEMAEDDVLGLVKLARTEKPP